MTDALDGPLTALELVEIVAALASAISKDEYTPTLPPDNRQSLHDAYRKAKMSLEAAQLVESVPQEPAPTARWDFPIPDRSRFPGEIFAASRPENPIPFLPVDTNQGMPVVMRDRGGRADTNGMWHPVGCLCPGCDV